MQTQKKEKHLLHPPPRKGSAAPPPSAGKRGAQRGGDPTPARRGALHCLINFIALNTNSNSTKFVIQFLPSLILTEGCSWWQER